MFEPASVPTSNVLAGCTVKPASRAYLAHSHHVRYRVNRSAALLQHQKARGRTSPSTQEQPLSSRGSKIARASASGRAAQHSPRLPLGLVGPMSHGGGQWCRLAPTVGSRRSSVAEGRGGLLVSDRIAPTAHCLARSPLPQIPPRRGRGRAHLWIYTPGHHPV